MRLYVANRGEIASRILRTAKRMQIRTLVGFCSEDESLPFVYEADESKLISSANPRDAYLNPELVLKNALEMRATHLHPGYGFLSEKADFVDQVQKAGIQFVGPSSDSMRKLGDKIGSRVFLKKIGISLLPSYEGEDQSDDRLFSEARQLGFPILIKPSAGGGGKGMFIVQGEEDFLASLASSKRIAKSSFNDERVFLERLVKPARHIEVQILADQAGNVLCLGERECSLQRRHQKVIEETPCVFLPDSIRKKIFDESKKIAEAVGYVNAGTVEWIWDGKEGVYFLEVNTRLQVEHPVTEEVWGIDLVEWQLRIARSETIKELKPAARGHAIEARLCAEDPENDFLPSGGLIHRFKKDEEKARFDFGFEEKNVVSSSFDSMMGKVICWAENREQAIDLLISALESLVLMGPKTNRGYLIQILKDASVREGSFHTDYLKEIPFRFDWQRALQELKRLEGSENLSQSIESVEEDLDWYSPWGSLNRAQEHSWWEDFQGRRFFHLSFADWSVPHKKRNESSSSARSQVEEQKEIQSPMPSKIIQVLVAEGDSVKKGDRLLILEAMKMEHQVKATLDGRVKAVHVKAGDQVPPDFVLLELE